MKCSRPSLKKVFIALNLIILPASLSAEAALFRINEQAIAEAAGEGLLDYTESGRRQRTRSYALAYLANVAHYHPDHVTVDNKTVVEHVLKHVRFMISGSIERTDPDRTPEPPCTGGTGSLGWNVSGTAQAFAVIRHTPAIWNELTTTEQDKVRWIVKAMAVAAQWTHHDGNDARITIDGESGFKKWHNPNHQAGYLSVAIGAAAFFLADGTTLDEVLASFNYDSWIAKFEEYRLLHTKTTWTVWPEVKEYMMNGGTLPGDAITGVGENGVRAPFTRVGLSMNDPVNGWAILADLIFHWEAQSRIANRHSDDPERQFRCREDAISSVEGRYGMMYEFIAGDGSGMRSSLLYSQVTWRIFSLIQATIITCGYMPDNEMARDINRRYYVGTRDIFFKGEHEWFSRGNGKEEWQSWTPERFMRSMFEDYTGRVEPDHEALNESEEYEVENAVHILEPMMVVDDQSASGGQFVEVPLGTGDNPDDLLQIDDTTYREKLANPNNPMYPGQITMEINVRRSRFYRIEALIGSPSNAHDALYFSSEKSQHKHFFGWKPKKVTVSPSEEWQWAEIADSVFFRYGGNRFLLAWWEDGVRIDKIRITNCGDEATAAEDGAMPKRASVDRPDGNAEALVSGLLAGRSTATAIDGSMLLTVSDTRGRRVAQISIQDAKRVDRSVPHGFPPGLYVYRLDRQVAGTHKTMYGRVGAVVW